MRKLNIIPLLLSVAVFTACADRKEDSKDKDKSAGADKTETEEAVGAEDYELFFRQFEADPAFQKSRVKFPLLSRYIDFDENNESFYEDEWTDEDKWETLSFDPIYTESNFSHSMDEFESVVHQTGLDNGVSVDYHFNLIDGKWYLVEIKNHSM